MPMGRKSLIYLLSILSGVVEFTASRRHDYLKWVNLPCPRHLWPLLLCIGYGCWWVVRSFFGVACKTKSCAWNKASWVAETCPCRAQSDKCRVYVNGQRVNKMPLFQVNNEFLVHGWLRINTCGFLVLVCWVWQCFVVVVNGQQKKAYFQQALRRTSHDNNASTS